MDGERDKDVGLSDKSWFDDVVDGVELEKLSREPSQWVHVWVSLAVGEEDRGAAMSDIVGARMRLRDERKNDV